MRVFQLQRVFVTDIFSAGPVDAVNSVNKPTVGMSKHRYRNCELAAIIRGFARTWNSDSNTLICTCKICLQDWHLRFTSLDSTRRASVKSFNEILPSKDSRSSNRIRAYSGPEMSPCSESPTLLLQPQGRFPTFTKIKMVDASPLPHPQTESNERKQLWGWLGSYSMCVLWVLNGRLSHLLTWRGRGLLHPANRDSQGALGPVLQSPVSHLCVQVMTTMRGWRCAADGNTVWWSWPRLALRSLTNAKWASR